MCLEPGILVEHHIRGRDIPHPNHPSNLAHICPNCHILVHSGLRVIEGWFQTSNGKELIWHKEGEESISGQDARPYTFLKS